MTSPDNIQVTAPSALKDGLTFLPIPEVTDADIAFGAQVSAYFNRRDLPDVPRQYTEEVSRLFFSGGEWPQFGSDIDAAKAKRWIKAMLGSWAPAHEAKQATVAYALWVWSPEAAEARKAAEQPVLTKEES